jgi:hypothetical protein
MKSNQITLIFFAFITILGWNAWAIKRDAKLFEVYDYQRAKIEFCSSQAGWHPDCNDDKIYKRYYEKTIKEGASK